MAKSYGFDLTEVQASPKGGTVYVFTEEPEMILNDRTPIQVTLDTNERVYPVTINNVPIDGFLRNKGNHFLGFFTLDELLLLHSYLDLTAEFAEKLDDAFHKGKIQ